MSANSSEICVKSATRVDLAGGTVDLWPFYSILGGATTVNLSIDVWTEASIEPREDGLIELQINDLNYSKTFDSLEAVLACVDPEIRLIRSVVEFFKPTMGFLLKTRSMSPVGGGLGGSSSLCISLMKAFSGLMGRSYDIYKMVEIAHNIEAQVLTTLTGTQDYYPAVRPGLHVIEYGFEGSKIETLDFPQELFDERMVLVYTGRPHDSGINNWQVMKAAIDGDKSTMIHLKEIADIGAETAQVCRSSQWDALSGLFQREYRARVDLCDSFCSPEIERLRDITVNHGAESIKICGAGGGGCVMLWVEPGQKDQVISHCQQNGFQVLDARALHGESQPTLIANA